MAEQHETYVLTGEDVGEFRMLPKYTAVAGCSCGWFELAVHGQEAEEKAAEHSAQEANA